MPQKRFRVIRDVRLPRTERVVKWTGSKPSCPEWAKALAHIDEYWAKGYPYPGEKASNARKN